MSRLHKHSYIKSIEALVIDTNTVLDHITVPAHVICGADDPLTPLSMSREIVQLIPHATLTVVPDAGHLLNIENPVDFNNAALGPPAPPQAGIGRSAGSTPESPGKDDARKSREIRWGDRN